jgi:hypothetical protein
MIAKSLRIFKNYAKVTMLLTLALLLFEGKSFAQSCKIDDVALYAWLGDSDGNYDLSTSDDEDADDWIGFVNRGTSPVDIGGWELFADQKGNSTPVFTFPSPTMLSPGAQVFVISHWDGGPLRSGWFNANYNSGEGMFEETSDGEAWAALRKPGGNYMMYHTGANQSLSSGTKVCNVSVVSALGDDEFEGCDAVILNETTGNYYKINSCSFASGFPDTDGDGTPDATDDDIDADGIINSQDKLPADTDNDGTPNVTDTDDDGDGIPDTSETPALRLNTDNDGLPNSTDTDDDGDGLPDASEIGVLDGNGKYTLPDSDGDGLPDLADPIDTDKDDIPDHIDLDNDNDGITDVIEGGNTLDSDGDGIPNRIDLDSDNDGISDLRESGNPGVSADTDNDGTIQASESPVGNNGIPLILESNTEGGVVPAPIDTDTDGTPDYRDLTSNGGTDQDIDHGPGGVLDANDNGVIDTAESGGDVDGDGIADAIDTKPGVFGGLPFYPDLTPVLIMSQPDFSTANTVRSFTLEIYNISSVASSGTVTVYIIKPTPNFSIVFSGSGWVSTNNGAFYTLTTSGVVPADFSGSLSISGTITRGAGVAKGVYNLQAVIGDNSGNEVDNTNNTANVTLNVNP